MCQMDPGARKPDLVARECHIMITFSINLDADQAQQNIRPALNQNCSINKYECRKMGLVEESMGNPYGYIHSDPAHFLLIFDTN